MPKGRVLKVFSDLHTTERESKKKKKPRSQDRKRGDPGNEVGKIRNSLLFWKAMNSVRMLEEII